MARAAYRRRGLLGLVFAVLLLPCAAAAAPDDYMQIQRGRELAAAGDCVACHTAPGGQPYAGGAVLQTPFGGIMTPNLTPDPGTGIGQWTADDFYRAMHTGIGPRGKHLYPAFPYPYFTKVTREDSDAIWLWLRTLPPVRNDTSHNTLPFPFNIRLLMIGWNTLFFTPGTFKPALARSAEYNRGAYLVDGLGHCGACHTPMNWAGANENGRYLQGGQLDHWVSPNITNAPRTGIGGWSVDDLVTYLKTGRNVHSQATGPMADVVMDSTSHMTDADLHAIAAYLKQRGAAAPSVPQPLSATEARMQAGEAVYVDNCSACHARNGSGVKLLFPPLAGDPVAQQTDPTTLLRIVLTGTQGAATDAAPTGPAMPSFGWRLSNQQVADVITYIRNSWGNAAPPVGADAVQSLRAVVSATTVHDHQD